MKQIFEEEELVQMKGKVHTIARHERPEWKYRRRSTVSLTSALRLWVGNATQRPLYLRVKDPLPIV